MAVSYPFWIRWRYKEFHKQNSRSIKLKASQTLKTGEIGCKREKPSHDKKENKTKITKTCHQFLKRERSSNGALGVWPASHVLAADQLFEWRRKCAETGGVSALAVGGKAWFLLLSDGKQNSSCFSKLININ